MKKLITLKQVGGYLVFFIVAYILVYITCLIIRKPFTIQEVYNVIALVALLRTMEQ